MTDRNKMYQQPEMKVSEFGSQAVLCASTVEPVTFSLGDDAVIEQGDITWSNSGRW